VSFLLSRPPIHSGFLAFTLASSPDLSPNMSFRKWLQWAPQPFHLIHEGKFWL
jgi:hypothetical protein